MPSRPTKKRKEEAVTVIDSIPQCRHTIALHIDVLRKLLSTDEDGHGSCPASSPWHGQGMHTKPRAEFRRPSHLDLLGKLLVPGESVPSTPMTPSSTTHSCTAPPSCAAAFANIHEHVDSPLLSTLSAAAAALETRSRLQCMNRACGGDNAPPCQAEEAAGALQVYIEGTGLSEAWCETVSPKSATAASDLLRMLHSPALQQHSPMLSLDLTLRKRKRKQHGHTALPAQHCNNTAMLPKMQANGSTTERGGLRQGGRGGGAAMGKCL
jgi:hypothetical protein